jgi:hypothetical protein
MEYDGAGIHGHLQNWYSRSLVTLNYLEKREEGQDSELSKETSYLKISSSFQW